MRLAPIAIRALGLWDCMKDENNTKIYRGNVKLSIEEFSEVALFISGWNDIIKRSNDVYDTVENKATLSLNPAGFAVLFEYK